LIAAVALGLFSKSVAGGSLWRRLGRALGVVMTVWAAAVLVGLAAGSSDPLRPLAVLAARAGNQASVANIGSSAAATASQSDLTFAPVRSSDQLDQAVKTAAQPAMLDFYADWCVSCKEMEKFTFSDPRVQAKLKQMNLLRADVTANNTDDQTLLKRFNLFGPPGIIFFDQGGKEVLRVVGYESADKFLRTLDRASASGV
jgi:thiol:disulfide interchange protein DsbD